MHASPSARHPPAQESPPPPPRLRPGVFLRWTLRRCRWPEKRSNLTSSSSAAASSRAAPRRASAPPPASPTHSRRFSPTAAFGLACVTAPPSSPLARAPRPTAGSTPPACNNPYDPRKARPGRPQLASPPPHHPRRPVCAEPQHLVDLKSPAPPSSPLLAHVRLRDLRPLGRVRARLPCTCASLLVSTASDSNPVAAVAARPQ